MAGTVTILKFQGHSPSLVDIQSQDPDDIAISRDVIMGYAVHCYSREAQMDSFKGEAVWNPVLLNTRGTTFDCNGKLVSRVVPKLFNLGEPLAQWTPEYDQMNIVLLEKFDGSCVGRFTAAQGHYAYRYHTKGGIDHDHEKWARQAAGEARVFGEPTKSHPSWVEIFELVDKRDAQVIKYPEGLYHLMTWRPETDTFEINLERYPGQVIHVASLAQALELQSFSQLEGFILHVYDANGTVFFSCKLKSPFYLKMRQAKALMEKQTPDHELYRQFKLDANGNVFYDYTFAIDRMGIFYDDWQANIQNKIRRVELELNSKLMYARAFCAGNSALTRREFYEKAGDNAPLIMAVFDGVPAKLIKVVNGVAYGAMNT